MVTLTFPIVNVRDLKAGMVFEHPRFGFPLTVVSVEDTSSPSWLRAACDPGHYDVECEDYGTVRITKGNMVRVTSPAEPSTYTFAGDPTREEPCKYGHLNCAYVEGGSCYDEEYANGAHR